MESMNEFRLLWLPDLWPILGWVFVMGIGVGILIGAHRSKSSKKREENEYGK